MLSKLGYRCILAAVVCVMSQVFASDVRAQAWGSSIGCNCGGESVGTTNGLNSYQANMHWMRPTPVYTSSSASVPVTYYRPQAVVDPLTGSSMSTLYPCNTYELQQRRTPGCAFWQRIVSWWRSRFCNRCRPVTPTCTPVCGTSSEWIVSTAPATTSPYYTPTNNGQLVPIPSRATSPTTPSGVAPSPVPADRRPVLDPTNRQIDGRGARSRSNALDEVFVNSFESQDAAVELVAPRLSPETTTDESEHSQSQNIPRLLQEIPNNKTALETRSASQLVPVSWSTSAAGLKPTIQTNQVWDDTGWHTEQ